MSENQEPALDVNVLAEVEALLFATDVPLGADRIQALTALKDRKSVRTAIESLRESYDTDGRSFTVVEFGGGYSINTRPEHATLVRKLFKGRRKQRLTRASLEALAIVAYKQPVTRLEIEEIRGVAASGVLGTLLERDLIQIVGRAESLGHPLLYGTTRGFLDYLGLSRVRDLPQLTELEDLLAEREDLKQLAYSRGENLEEEDFDRALHGGEEELSVGEAEEEVEPAESVDEVSETVEQKSADDEAEASA
jgi:segregation and condensation protein B